jgi:hypothetical protein
MKLHFLSFSLLMTTPALLAQSGGEFIITRSTMDAGGGLLAGGNYQLQGTLGQPEASRQTPVAGDYSMNGGFWRDGVVITDEEVIFQDGFEDGP